MLSVFEICSTFSLITASSEFMFGIPCVNAFAPALQGGVAKKLDPVGSTVRYEMVKLCSGSV